MQLLVPTRHIGKTLIIFLKDKNTVVLVSSLSGFFSIPLPLSRNKSLYKVGNEHKADKIQKLGLGYHMRRSPAVSWERWGKDSNTLQWVDVFPVVEAAPHKDEHEAS